jgi:hypothetical protein
MTITSALPLPPKEYSQEYMNRLVRQLELTIRRQHAGGPITAGSDPTQSITQFPVSALTLNDIPTSPTGLPSGSVWSDGGTLKIVS